MKYTFESTAGSNLLSAASCTTFLQFQPKLNVCLRHLLNELHNIILLYPPSSERIVNTAIVTTEIDSFRLRTSHDYFAQPSKSFFHRGLI